MILQALTQLYEALLARGEIPPLGWSAINISYALCLGEDGQLEEVVPTLQEVDAGKGITVLRPQDKGAPRRRQTCLRHSFQLSLGQFELHARPG